MKYSTVFALLSLVPAGRASGDDQKVLHLGVNDPCTGAGGRPGVCIATAACTAGGGDFISGACPGTPTDIKCCTKASCGTTGGDCRWASTCSSGSVLAGLCPGPANFKCCFPPNPLGNLPGLNAPQSMHSRVIISRVINMPGIANSDRKRACYVAMVTARQESSILVLANRNVADSYNYPYDGVGSDHDSVGIFQQRASWGTTRDRMDPVSFCPKAFASNRPFLSFFFFTKWLMALHRLLVRISSSRR